MTDPINPRQSGPELLEQILRECPNLTRDEVLQIAASAGFDLMDLGRPSSTPPAPASGTPSTE